MTEVIFTFVLFALVVWRLAMFVAIDEGPFGVCRVVRSRIDPPQKTWIGRGIRCIHCLSFWFGFLAAIYLYWRGDIPSYEGIVVWGLALSGAAIFLNGVSNQ